jgi:hypothetical protein
MTPEIQNDDILKGYLIQSFTETWTIGHTVREITTWCPAAFIYPNMFRRYESLFFAYF